MWRDCSAGITAAAAAASGRADCARLRQPSVRPAPHHTGPATREKATVRWEKLLIASTKDNRLVVDASTRAMQHIVRLLCNRSSTSSGELINYSHYVIYIIELNYYYFQFFFKTAVVFLGLFCDLFASDIW